MIRSNSSKIYIGFALLSFLLTLAHSQSNFESPADLGQCWAVLQFKRYKTGSLNDGERRFLNKAGDRVEALDNAVERSRPACLSTGGGDAFNGCMRRKLTQDEYDYFFAHETRLIAFQKDSSYFDAAQGFCKNLFQ